SSVSSAFVVGFFDRRQLVEVALDARGELLGLRLHELPLALAPGAVTPSPRLVPVARREPWPLGADHSRDRAHEQGDHQPAHAAILPAPPPGTDDPVPFMR